MSKKRGRLFCNTLCPVGALLSLFSKFSLYSVRIREEDCTSCGACGHICKAEAADSASRTIDASRCISCFNCMSVCSFNAVEYGRNKNAAELISRFSKKPDISKKLKVDRVNNRESFQNSDRLNSSESFLNIDKFNIIEYSPEDIQFDMQKADSGKDSLFNDIPAVNQPEKNGVSHNSRRDYLKKAAAGDQSGKNGVSHNSRRDFLKITAAGSVILASSLLLRQKSYVFKNKADIRAVPPGALSINNMLSKCTGCALCINNCPTGVLKPSVFSHFGISGFAAPFLDYEKSYCDYKCKRCSDICPAGALIKLDLETKKTVKIGEAEFVRKYCIVETDRTSCGACAEVCPTGAIDLVHIGSSESGPLEIPVISSRYCIGCGACEFACPVIEKNAIFVNPYSVHEKADPPAEEDESRKTANYGSEKDNTDTGFAF